jgi:hypothetical protein
MHDTTVKITNHSLVMDTFRLIKVTTGLAQSVWRLASGCTVQGSDSGGIEVFRAVQTGPETTKQRVQWIPTRN